MSSVTWLFLSIGTSIAGSVLQVFLSWLLIYRRRYIQDQKALLEKKQDELEKAELAQDTEDGSEKKLAKRVKKLKEEIKSIQQDLTKKTAWQNFAMMGFLLVFNMATRQYFSGRICCKIPFTPFKMIQKITHGGIDNTDMTDGSYNLIYWMSAMLFREALNRIFGFSIPGGNMMEQMQKRMTSQ